MDASVVVDYTAHLDAKHRLTLRGAKYDYYQVRAVSIIIDSSQRRQTIHCNRQI